MEEKEDKKETKPSEGRRGRKKYQMNGEKETDPNEERKGRIK